MPSVQRLSHSVTIVLAAAGITDTPFLTYDPALSRVRVDQTVLATINGAPPPDGATRIVERSTDLIRWITVRGGGEDVVDPGAGFVDDYEFDADTQNTYRIRVLFEGDLYWTLRDQITVTLDQVWLKSIRYPFLNQEVDASTKDPSTHPAAGGVFKIVGRSDPVAVTDYRGSRQYTLTIATTSPADIDSVQALFAPGDVILVQAPASYRIPSGYYWVGDITEDDRKSADLDRRWWTLPLTKVAAPAETIVGAPITWRGLANRYASLADMMAANATWGDVLDLVGAPGDVVVP